MALILDVDHSLRYFVPGQIYLPGSSGKSAESQGAVVARLMKKSGGMLGSGQDSVFQRMASGGYMPLNDLEQAHKNKLTGEAKRRSDAYTELVRLGMRPSKTVVTSWLEGFGANPEDVPPGLNKEYEYNRRRWEVRNNASLARLQDPKLEVKQWMDDLNINFNGLREALINPFEIDKEIYIPPEVLARMKELGLFRLKVPKKFGGLGLNQREYDAVLRALVLTYSGTLAGMISAHSTIGAKPLLLYGDFDQKRYHLAKIANGDGLCAFALTERCSGTDAINNAETIAKKSKDGKSYILNGSKIYITNTQRASHMFILAKVDDGGVELKPTVFILELPFRLTDNESDIETKRKALEKSGLHISKPLVLSGIRGSNQAYIEFNNFEIPAVNESGVSNILGGVGEGTKVIFNSLNAGRAGFGSFCAEAAKNAFNLAVLEAIQRRRFDEHGGRLADLPQVKKYISEMAIRTEALDATAELTTNLIDTFPNMNIIAECAAIKALATEETWNVTQTASRIFGGEGLMKGFPIELMMRDMWVPLIVEGVNEALKQHMVGVSSKPLLKASTNPMKFLELQTTKLLMYESGGLDLNDMWWLQRKTKAFSDKVLFLGMFNGSKTILKQRELIALADEAIELYEAAAVMLKLKEGNLPEHKVKALKQFIKNLKHRKKEYPTEIANAYIKVAEEDLRTQRTFEEKEMVRK